MISLGFSAFFSIRVQKTKTFPPGVENFISLGKTFWETSGNFPLGSCGGSGELLCWEGFGNEESQGFLREEGD